MYFLGTSSKYLQNRAITKLRDKNNSVDNERYNICVCHKAPTAKMEGLLILLCGLISLICGIFVVPT